MAIPMTRILCIHSGGSSLRGSEFSLLDHLTFMRCQGKAVRLLCDNPIFYDKAAAIGIDVDILTRGEIMFDPPTLEFQVGSLMRSNWQVLRTARKFRAEVLYCNGGRALQMAYLAARVSGTPIAVHLRIPHSRRYLIQYGTTRADLVIHCSNGLRIDHEHLAKFRRSVALPNSIDERLFPAIDQLRRPASNPPTIGFIGAIHHTKGVDVLIDAVKLLRDNGTECQLLIAGPEMDPGFRALAQRLDVPVSFLGPLSREKIPEFFSRVHIHALPSRLDAMARTVIEAAYCGVPSIATAVGGIPEAMLHGKLGVLYENNTSEELALRLRQMLDSDWMSVDTSQKIAHLARGEFNQAANTERLCALLASISRNPLDRAECAVTRPQ